MASRESPKKRLFLQRLQQIRPHRHYVIAVAAGAMVGKRADTVVFSSGFGALVEFKMEGNKAETSRGQLAALTNASATGTSVFYVYMKKGASQACVFRLEYDAKNQPCLTPCKTKEYVDFDVAAAVLCNAIETSGLALAEQLKGIK